MHIGKPVFHSTRELLAFARARLDLAQVDFAEKLSGHFSGRNYKRYEQGHVQRDPIIDALHLIHDLAQLLGWSPFELLQSMDIGKPLVASPLRQTNIEPRPLVSQFPSSEARTNEAIYAALDGRRLYFSGQIKAALRKYEEAARLANDAKEYILEAYIKVFIGNCQEMLGQIGGARKTLCGVQKTVDELLGSIDDTELRRILQVIKLRAEVNLVWVKWATGMHSAAIQDVGVTMGNEMDVYRHLEPTLYVRAFELGDYYSFARIYGVLARSSIALGLGNAAKYYADKSLLYAYLFENPEYKKTALFLDYPTNLAEHWRIDQQARVMIDILIANGEPEKAFEYYRALRFHRDPASHFNLHNWFDPAWQALLEKMKHEKKLHAQDWKPDIPYERWDSLMEHGGDFHIRALIKRSYAQLQRHNGKLPHAQTLLDEAMKTAKNVEAWHTFVVCGLEACEVALQLGILDLAQQKLDMIQEKLAQIENPFLDTKYATLQETIDGLRHT